MQSSNDDEFEDVRLGRSLSELTIPRSPLMPHVEVFDGHLLQIEASLRPSVPEQIRKRIGVTRNLAVYGAFCYDFFAVAIYWSYTCIEMALWTKFREMNPETQHSKATLGGLAKWASEQQLLPSHLNAGALVHLRNSFAHPKEFSVVLTPGMAVEAFRLLVEVVNHLWPLDLT